jgi:hypothetical protein
MTQFEALISITQTVLHSRYNADVDRPSLELIYQVLWACRELLCCSFNVFDEARNELVRRYHYNETV